MMIPQSIDITAIVALEKDSHQLPLTTFIFVNTLFVFHHTLLTSPSSPTYQYGMSEPLRHAQVSSVMFPNRNHFPQLIPCQRLVVRCEYLIEVMSVEVSYCV